MITYDSWELLVTDFDLFMEKNGFLSVEKAAEKWETTERYIRNLITRGNFIEGTDYIKVSTGKRNGRIYISKYAKKRKVKNENLYWEMNTQYKFHR